MKKLARRITDLDEAKAFNEVNHAVQRGLDHGLARPSRGKAQDRALPQVLVIALGNRDIEVIGGPRLDALQNSALALE